MGMLALTSVGFIGLATAHAASVVSLGAASSYAVLAATTVTDAGASTISGELGVAPGTAVTGFPPGIVTNGSIHSNDPATNDAQVDAHSAYVAAAAQPSDRVVGTSNLAAAGPAGSLNTLTPGVYSSASSLDLTGTLVLDGQGNTESVFLFQAGSTLTTASYSEVTLINGAQASHVFWQLGSSATLGTYSRMVGTILAHTSITSTTAVVTTGRLIALGAAVTLDGGSVSAPAGTAAPAPSPTPTATDNVTADVAPVITSADGPDGVEGVAYEFEVTASGSPTPTFAISTGSLPPGLVLDAVTGVISGTPTTAVDVTFDVTASNAAGTDTDSLTVKIARAPLAPLITSGDIPDGRVGTAVNFTVTASGFPAPTFTVSDGVLPVGLSLDGVTGVISGTPTVAEDSMFMISASNGVNPSSTAMYSVAIAPQPFATVAPLITSGDSPDGVAGVAYEFTVTATGSPTPTFTLTGFLPPGLLLDGVTGVISGTPTTAGDNTFQITAMNTAGSDTDAMTLTVAPAAAPVPVVDPAVAPVITSADGPDGVEGVAYAFEVTASGSPTPTFAISTGSLPPGLVLDAVTGVISGTPTTAVDVTFDVTASNAAGTDTDSLTVKIARAPLAPLITSGDIPDGRVGTAVNFTVTASGFPAPTFTLTGFLPTGLFLDGVTGLISGTPTTAGDNTFQITAMNTAGSDTDVMTLTEAPATVPEPVPAPAPVPTGTIDHGESNVPKAGEGTVAAVVSKLSPDLAAASSPTTSVTVQDATCGNSAPSDGGPVVYLDLSRRSANSGAGSGSDRALGCTQASATVAGGTPAVPLLSILAAVTCAALLGLIARLGFILIGRTRRRDEAFDFQI